MKWVESQGGYFNPKQELRSDDDGLFGVFATQPIEEEEILASIPWDVVVGSETHGRFKNCKTVKVLADELEKSESLYARKLHETVREHEHLLPTHWSKQGQSLLLKVTDNGVLAPQDPFMKDFKWKSKCEKISKDATQLVLTHGEDIGMVPITDKYNSRSGNYTGAYFSIEGGKKNKPALEIRAKRDIGKGEQIYTNYKDYIDHKDGRVGTPELLRDYGFVEMYPQRYIFPSYGMAFDVKQYDHDDFEIIWKKKLKGKKYNPDPSSEAIQFLQEQLERLEQVYAELLELADDNDWSVVPDNEMQTILRFCVDYKTAIALAIDDATSDE